MKICWMIGSAWCRSARNGYHTFDYGDDQNSCGKIMGFYKYNGIWDTTAVELALHWQ